MTGQPKTKPRLHGALLYGHKAIMAYTGLKGGQLQRLMKVEGFPVFVHKVGGFPVVMTTKVMIDRWAENRLNHEAMTQEEYEMLSHWVDKSRDGDPIERLAVVSELRKRRLLTNDGIKNYEAIKKDYDRLRKFRRLRETQASAREIFDRTMNEQ